MAIEGCESRSLKAPWDRTEIRVIWDIARLHLCQYTLLVALWEPNRRRSGIVGVNVAESEALATLES